MKIQRLNMDSSWQITYKNTSILIDPWLIGTEIDGFSWFNEQWHAHKPIEISKLANYNAILISQSYPDHCHFETINKLNNVPIYSVPSAYKKLKNKFKNRNVIKLYEIDSTDWIKIDDFEIKYLDPFKLIDPIYNGLVIKVGEGLIVYLPHTFELKKEQLDWLKNYKIDLLITSFSFFRIPNFLGGLVNPGTEKALKLISILNPKKVVHTHDENKHAKGIIKKIAKVKYPDFEFLKDKLLNRFVYLGNEYKEVVF